jgi:hypothetical protein
MEGSHALCVFYDADLLSFLLNNNKKGCSERLSLASPATYYNIPEKADAQF